MKTKLIAGCMAAVIAAGCLTYAAYDSGDVRAAYAATVDDLTFHLEDSYAYLAGCKTSASGELTVPAEYQGVPVTRVGTSYAPFANCYDLTKIILPDSITSIWSSSFSHAERLRSINIPGGVSDIPSRCFEYCFSLTDVQISEGVLHIADGAFYGCTSLRSIEFPASITRIGSSVFRDCSLENVTIINRDAIINPLGGKVNQITGYSGSTAETYAKENKIDFMDIQTGEVVPGTITTTTRPYQGTTTTTRPYQETTATTTKAYYATTTAKASISMQKSMLKFDVNGNGSVNIADAVLLARLVSEDSSAPYPKYGNPDVNGDGVLTVEDIRIVLNALRPFSVQIGNASAKPGAKVTVPVQIYGDKGTAGGQVYISYDSRLTPVSVTAGDAYAASIHSESAYYPIYIGWSTNDGMEQTAKDGAVLAYLEFTVDANIRQTEYLAVSVMNAAGQNSTRFSDSDGYVYSANCGSGFVTVTP